MQTIVLQVNITTAIGLDMGPEAYASEVNQIRRIMRDYFTCLEDAKGVATKVTLDECETGANIILNATFTDTPIDYLNLTDDAHALFRVLYPRLAGIAEGHDGVWGVLVRVRIEKRREVRELQRGWLSIRSTQNYQHGSLLEPSYYLDDLPDDDEEEED